jgi:hypothetical protein
MCIMQLSATAVALTWFSSDVSRSHPAASVDLGTHGGNGSGTGVYDMSVELACRRIFRAGTLDPPLPLTSSGVTARVGGGLASCLVLCCAGVQVFHVHSVRCRLNITGVCVLDHLGTPHSSQDSATANLNPLGRCTWGWFSSQCEHNVFQYSTGFVPPSCGRVAGWTLRRVCDSDADSVAVTSETRLQSEQLVRSRRYRELVTHY